jgi:hypothetical protein
MSLPVLLHFCRIVSMANLLLFSIQILREAGLGEMRPSPAILARIDRMERP